MVSRTLLRGSSWDHPRGHAPMVATATEYLRGAAADVHIEWIPRSLKAFGVDVVERLAAEYDLVLIDHPHVGTLANSGCVVPLDDHLDTTMAAELAAESPGGSYESYRYEGRLWALPVDAACQVACWRPDLLAEPPQTWDDVVDLAATGRVLWPLCDVDAAASFLSLAALAGAPCATGSAFCDRSVGRWALELMRTVAALSDPACLRLNPIGALDHLASAKDALYAPLLFGYVNYSRLDAQGARVHFGDVPTVGGRRSGALLGGVGLAVSSRSAHRELAVDYARYVASPAVQRGLYFSAGGQPAHASAWTDKDVDRLSGEFFSGTALTMNSAWTRPRYPRFAEFQNDMISLFASFAVRHPDMLLDELEERYAISRSDAP